MKIEYLTTSEVTVVLKNETPWEVNGNKGITYRIAILVNNDIEKLKCVDKTAYDSIPQGGVGQLYGYFDVRNGSVSEPKILGFRPKK